jgi:hypothetical protein
LNKRSGNVFGRFRKTCDKNVEQTLDKGFLGSRHRREPSHPFSTFLARFSVSYFFARSRDSLGSAPYDPIPSPSLPPAMRQYMLYAAMSPAGVGGGGCG